MKLPAHHGAVAPFGPPCAIQALAPLEGCSPRKAFLERAVSSQELALGGITSASFNNGELEIMQHHAAIWNRANVVEKQAGQRDPPFDGTPRAIGNCLERLAFAQPGLGPRANCRAAERPPLVPYAAGDPSWVRRLRWRWQDGPLALARRRRS